MHSKVPVYNVNISTLKYYNKAFEYFLRKEMENN